MTDSSFSEAAIQAAENAKFEDFENNTYTEEELLSVKLKPYLPWMLLESYTSMAVIVVITAIGGAIGTYFFGGAGSVVGLAVSFVASGLLVLRFPSKIDPREYRAINDSRGGSLFIGIMLGSLPGLVFGMKTTQSILNYLHMNEAGFSVHDLLIIPLAGMLCPIIPLIVGIAFVLVQEKRNKKSVVKDYLDWKSKIVAKDNV